jgi:hypothetical protein
MLTAPAEIVRASADGKVTPLTRRKRLRLKDVAFSAESLTATTPSGQKVQDC